MYLGLLRPKNSPRGERELRLLSRYSLYRFSRGVVLGRGNRVKSKVLVQKKRISPSKNGVVFQLANGDGQSCTLTNLICFSLCPNSPSSAQLFKHSNIPSKMLPVQTMRYRPTYPSRESCRLRDFCQCACVKRSERW